MSSENTQTDVSGSQVHQDGIDNIKSQTGTESSQQPPASNPGSDDASAGISKDSGGVSSSAYVDSPVPSEQKGYVQSTVDTVKGLLGGLSLGGAGAATAGQEGEGAGATETKTAEGETSSSSTAATGGVVASTAAAASAATAAVLGSKKEEQNDTTSDTKMTDATDSATTNTSTTQTSTDVKDDPTADSASKESTTLKSDTAPETDSSKRDHHDEDNKLSDAPGEGASAAKKDNWPKENRDAIPTAGGEKLGQKHWGESEVVPDLPKKQDEGSEANVSSKEGQPDNQTRDNTAQNTGGAAPPASSSSDNNTSSSADGEGKVKLTDKIKDKLNIGKKE